MFRCRSDWMTCLSLTCRLPLQTSDGQCHCTIGYQPFNNGDECAPKVYGVCKNGKTRTQHGDCWDRYQWLLHCRGQVRPCAILQHTHEQMDGCQHLSRAKVTGMCLSNQQETHLENLIMEMPWAFNKAKIKEINISSSIIQLPK